MTLPRQLGEVVAVFHVHLVGMAIARYVLHVAVQVGRIGPYHSVDEVREELVGTCSTQFSFVISRSSFAELLLAQVSWCNFAVLFRVQNSRCYFVKFLDDFAIKFSQCHFALRLLRFH